ncbi:MAG TPA: GTPase Era [Gammaproteobacteria bacterium]|nr:GTPase Era [Acidiferrobacteraceae bacterium]MDP6552344.1 GTPase Era [Arenicellales bacterium]MDP6790369.1 GTPase Era [Arenicellales bacterium]MDP6918157.1 GTPase Era [Arenicellales bacterium]HCX86547.1 GTPase Era [Gammaproteobacteria bacterium]
MNSPGHFGVVALVGRPNVGKSSLLNQILGSKVSIVSRRPQTTWREIDGIHMEGNSQLVIVDSPGMHKRKKRLLSKVANQSARGAGSGADIVCQVTDARHWSREDQDVLEHFAERGNDLWLVLNKVDLLARPEMVLPRIEELQKKHPWGQIVPVSARSGYNCKHLSFLLSEAVPEGQAGYPVQTLTNTSPQFLAAELIREQVFRQMGDEIPYCTGVELTTFRERPDGTMVIDAQIWCETTGQKAALIGAGGTRLKSIGSAARRQIESVFDRPVLLSQRVKVRKGWASDRRSVAALGYSQ